MDVLLDRYVYLLVVVLLAIGLYGMLARRNLVKKVIGMMVFQTAIYLFFIEGSVKRDATAPVIDPAIGSDPVDYVNPLPHLLILTAIVVGVGVVGVAFSLLLEIHREHGTLDEEEVAAQLAAPPDRSDPAAADPAAPDPAAPDPAAPGPAAQ
jgi:multicomponent Na+:H+ antiporter subunit C